METFKIPTKDNMVFAFYLDSYTYNGNTYIGIACNEAGYWEAYADLTVNLGVSLNKNQAYIDTNNLKPDFVKRIEQQEFIKDTGIKKQSGYVLYPLYELNLEKIKKYLLSRR